MNHISRAAIFTVMLSPLFDGTARGDDGITKVLQAKGILQYSEQLRKVMEPSEARQLEEWSKHSHHGIALAAKWEALNRLDVAEFNRRTRDVEIARFFGFVEGRLRVSIPTAWGSRIRSAEPVSDTFHFWRFPKDAKAGEAKIERIGDLVVVSADNKRFSIPISPGNVAPSRAVLLSTEKICYVAGLKSDSREYELLAFDPVTTELKWTTTVWADSTLYQGHDWSQEIEFVASPESIFVFGSNGKCIYIEAFSPATGENQFRFSNTYFEMYDYRR